MTPPLKATDGVDTCPAVARTGLSAAAGVVSGVEEAVPAREGHNDSGISATVEEDEREIVVTAPAGRIAGQSEGWDDKQRVDAVSTAAINGNVGAESSNSRDDVGKRGRRIIETEGAVENMRRRLSAMGFLEPGADSDAGGSGNKLGSPDSMSAGPPSGFSSKSKGRLRPAAAGATNVGNVEDSALASAVDYAATAAAAAAATASDFGAGLAEGTNLDALVSETGNVATAGESGAETVLNLNVLVDPRVEMLGALGGQGGRDAATTSSAAVALSDERSKGRLKIGSDTKEAKARGGPRRVTLDTATPSPPSHLRDNDDIEGRVAGVLDRRLHMGNEEEGGRGVGRPSYGAADAGGFTARKTSDVGKDEGDDEGVEITNYPDARRARDLVVSPTITGAGCSDSSLRNGSVLRSALSPQPTIATPPRTAAPAVLSTGEILPAAVSGSGGGRVSFVGGELAGGNGVRSSLATETGDEQRMSSWRRPRGGRGVEREVGLAVLPRPDEEYEKALLNLTAAAAHAAELYRELTEASSGSLSVAHEMAMTVTPGSAKNESSFTLTPPPARDDREGVGGGLGQKDNRKQGEGRGHIGGYLRCLTVAMLQDRRARVIEFNAALPRNNVVNCV